MIKCECDGWKENIDKINAPYMLNLSAIGQYDGKAFSFCPWCGTSIKEEKWEDGWIDVKDELPFDDYNDTNMDFFGHFLATVRSKGHDLIDDPEVMLLWFSTRTKQFTTGLMGDIYDKEDDWFVTHWMEKPEPAR
jgi:hypothetical protein